MLCAKIVNLVGTEEEYVAEASPIKYCLPVPSFKPKK
jgi:hypothetical protein